MTDRPPLARAATDLLAREDLPEVTRTADARTSAINALSAALVARKRRRRIQRISAVVSVSVAAAAAIVVVARRPAVKDTISLEGGARLVHDGAEVAKPNALTPGDQVIGTGTVVLATGTRVTLEAESNVAVASVGKASIFDVRAGRVRFDVAKLVGGDRFLVRTTDTEVEVRGTVFAVSVVTPEARCGTTPTRVLVREGVVVVRHGGAETKLVAGETWPRCTDAPPPVAAPSSTPTALPAMSGAPAIIAPKPVAPSDLALQNDLFADGVAKKRAGNREGAIVAFDQLLSKWPGSPHAETAAAERMRLASGPRAVSYAKYYLARFPHGFASSEARAIAGP
jgi:hypothetical protein